MKRLALALLATAAAVSAAPAADMAVKAVPYQQILAAPSWTGFYIGVNAGYANDYNQEAISGGNRIASLLVATGIVPGQLDTAASGWLAGATAGYNYELPQYSMVVGFEGDFDWTGLSGGASQTLTTAPLGFPLSLSTTANRGSDWFGTLRTRIGTTFLIPNSMIYATGGLAFQQEHETTTGTLKTPIAAFNATATNSWSQDKVGYAVGGGMETMITQHWTAKVEYLYLGFDNHLGQATATVLRTPVVFNNTQNWSESIVRAGVNYKF